MAQRKRKDATPVTETYFTDKCAEHQALSDGFHAEFTPDGPGERYLVNTLVNAAWRGRQLMRLDTAIWNAGRIEGGAAGENSSAAIFFRVGKQLDQVSRAGETYDKIFHSALKQLLQIRAQRAKRDKQLKSQAPVKRPAAASSGLFLVPKAPKKG